MKIEIQTLNKSIEEAKNKVQNSEEEVIGHIIIVHFNLFPWARLFESRLTLIPD